MMVNEAECKAAGVNTKKVASIARRLSKVAKEAHAMGIHIFGGSSSGTLRYRGDSDHALILAHLDGEFDGGDGAIDDYGDGLERGE